MSCHENVQLAFDDKEKLDVVFPAVDVKDGDIILMHDIYDSTAQASNIVIPELIKRGFQLVTVDELFEYRESTITAGEQYYNVYK